MTSNIYGDKLRKTIYVRVSIKDTSICGGNKRSITLNKLDGELCRKIMSKAVIPRRQGDEFQALFFWSQAVKLLTDKNVTRVTFESDKPAFLDDVVVEYDHPILNSFTGKQISIEYFQCKYHVAQKTLFTLDNLIDPKFVNSKKSMLERLYLAYSSLKDSTTNIQFTVVSSSTWDSQDTLFNFLSPEGHLLSHFYNGGPRSRQGKLRAELAAHIGINEKELRSFTELIRFDLGTSRTKLVESLNLSLQLANLLPIDTAITDTRYCELAWKLLEQGTNIFDKTTLSGIIQREKLIDQQTQLLLVRHQSLHPLAANAIINFLPNYLKEIKTVEIVVDQSDLFRNGRLNDPLEATTRQISILKSIEEEMQKSPDTLLGYYGIAHIPLVFLAGYQLNKRRKVYLFDHNREKDEWLCLEDDGEFPEIQLEGMPSQLNYSDNDVVLKMSISYPVIDKDIAEIIPRTSNFIHLFLSRPKIDSVRYKNQLEQYASCFRDALDLIHNNLPNVKRIHLFYAGPVPLAFKCGQLISPTIHPKVLIYNYYYQDTPRYKWGLPVPLNSNDSNFLIKL